MSLLTLAAVTLLQSCQPVQTQEKETDEATQTTVSEEQTHELAAPETYLVEKGICNYSLVYDLASSDAKRAANRLSQYLSGKCKVTVEVYSSDEVLYDPNAKEIYIGNTGFTESVQTADALLSLKSWCFTRQGNKLVLVAGTDSILYDKMNEYIENVLSKNITFDTATGKATVLFKEHSDNNPSEARTVLIGNKDLKDFVIVYENDTEGLYKGYAEMLRSTVFSSYGADLSVVSDETAPTANEILIGKPNRTEATEFCNVQDIQPLEYCMGLHNGKYVITGSGAFSVRIAVQRFINEYLLTISNEVKISEGQVLSKEYYSGVVEHAENSDARVMTLNMMAEYHAANAYGDSVLPPRLRCEVLESILDAYSPDVIGMQECSPLWRELMADRLDPNVWGIIDPGRSDGSNGETIIVYNKQRLTLKDGGSISYPSAAENSRICWGYFELKSDSTKQFVLLNTHWSWASATVADMEMEFMAKTAKEKSAAYGNIPVFCTGDFNTKWDSDRYNAFCEKSNLVDSFNVAKTNGKTVNEVGGYGNPGDESRKNTTYKNAVDHIFCPSTATVHRYQTVVDNRMVDLSDHAPRYADLSW